MFQLHVHVPLSLLFSAELPFDEGTDSDGVEDDDDVFTDSSQAIKNKQEVTLILYYTELTIKWERKSCWRNVKIYSTYSYASFFIFTGYC